MPPEAQSRALVPYGFEPSFLHPVRLQPARRRRKRWRIGLAALVLLLAGAAAAYLSQFGMDPGPIQRTLAEGLHLP